MSLWVLDARGEAVTSIVCSEDASATQLSLGAGVWFLESSGHDVALKYTLSGEARPTEPDTAPPSDDHGDWFLKATPLTLGTPMAGELTPLDRDFLRFEAEAGHTYRVRVEGTLRYYPLRIWGPTLGEVGRTGLPSYTVKAGVSGSHYVVFIFSYSGLGTTYTVRVEDVSEDDHGDTQESATPLTPGEAVAGHFDGSWDSDTFRFEAMAGHRYGVQVAGGTSTSHTFGVFNSQGESLAFGYDTFPLNKKLALGGVHYVRVESSTPSGTYLLNVEDYGADDHGDGIFEATSLPLGSDMSGAFQGPTGDDDYFSFGAQQGHTYRVRATPGTRVELIKLMPPLQTVASFQGGEMSVSLTSGTYYVKLSSGGAEGPYFLNVTDVTP
jgi:hypothetical protein